MRKILFSIFMLIYSSLVFSNPLMDQESMENIIKGVATESKGEKGFVEFMYKNVRMYLISDVKHNRMRIIAPVAKYKEISTQNIEAVLESNFHKSLDARYAISKGVLYSAYIHSLSELRDYQVKSAVQQVANLALSFGKEYSSGVLTYGGK